MACIDKTPAARKRSMILTVQADACTCEKASDGGLLPTETDFTGKA
jgi:hypothetical protein